MSGGRVPLFGQGDDLDLSAFQPKPTIEPKQLRDVAEQAGFRSREPAALAEAEKREPRRHRTGRNVQLNLKVRREAMERFYRLADAQGWVLGEAFEHAVDALERESGKAG